MQPYLILMLLGIAISATLWMRTYRKDPSLLFVYISGLLIAFLGAKVAYLLAEGWMHWSKNDFWLQLSTGKSVLGALLGGYIGVEMAKNFLGKRMVTGDFFASVAPLGIALGRLGCTFQGCCLGKELNANWFNVSTISAIARWPAPQVELAFNLAMLLLFALWRRQSRFTGQHFHIYLIAYGAFRFVHEFLRATPKPFFGLSGYQFIALFLLLFGLWAYRKRARSMPASILSPQQMPPSQTPPTPQITS